MSTASCYYVYGHYTKDTSELFYIGKGKGRRAYHSFGRNRYWKNMVKKHGLEVRILLQDLDNETAYLQERLAIADLKPRTNLTSGGYAGTYTRTAEQNLKQSEIQKKTPRQWVNGKHPWLGRSHSLKSRIQTSISKGGKPFIAIDSKGVEHGPFQTKRQAADSLNIKNPTNIYLCFKFPNRTCAGFKFKRVG